MVAFETKGSSNADDILDFLIESSNYVDNIMTAATTTELPKLDENNVPLTMALPPALQSSTSDLNDAPLQRLRFHNSTVNMDASLTTMQEVLRSGISGCPTICLVIRRPGCCFCRDDGQELTQLVQQHGPCNMFAIVKNVDDTKGLVDFYKRYFPFPIYRDVQQQTYTSLGNRKIWVRTYNPLRLLKGLFDVNLRLRKKRVTFNMKSWTDTVQGGVLIFDKESQLRYCYQEVFADELNMGEIRAALTAVQSKTMAALQQELWSLESATVRDEKAAAASGAGVVSGIVSGSSTSRTALVFGALVATTILFARHLWLKEAFSS